MEACLDEFCCVYTLCVASTLLQLENTSAKSNINLNELFNLWRLIISQSFFSHPPPPPRGEPNLKLAINSGEASGGDIFTFWTAVIISR